MKHRNSLIIILLLSSLLYSQLQAQGSQLIETKIPAPSLSNNILGVPDEQPVAIYLPPSYSISDKRYPVVYFLPGFGTPIIYFTRYGVFQGFLLQQSMDTLINEGKIDEMILVIPNGLTFMLGSFYVNSPVTGNWEDFIVKDLVSCIDENYRTLAHPSSRGISGHSMGGFGALNLAMLHPEVFSVTYALSAGLFDENGLSENSMFSDSSVIARFLQKEKEFSAMSEDEAKLAFILFITHLAIVENDDDQVFEYAYGAAFSPKSDKKAPYVDYPYHRSAGKLILDERARENYENGFGGLAEKVMRYKDNLTKLRSITIDYGTDDYYGWIPAGNIYFSKLLKAAGISHELVAYEGGHSNRVRERIEKYMLPKFSSTLVFHH